MASRGGLEPPGEATGRLSPSVKEAFPDFRAEVQRPLIGQALLEEVVFDDQGSPRTASLLDYLIPSIGEIPQVVTATTETLSPNNPLGAKGVGESGTIGSTPAVQNAVVDALSHLGIRHIDMPLTPERVWAALAGR